MTARSRAIILVVWFAKRDKFALPWSPQEARYPSDAASRCDGVTVVWASRFQRLVDRFERERRRAIPFLRFVNANARCRAFAIRSILSVHWVTLVSCRRLKRVARLIGS
jgi:hypothetical protein